MNRCDWKPVRLKFSLRSGAEHIRTMFIAALTLAGGASAPASAGEQAHRFTVLQRHDHFVVQDNGVYTMTRVLYVLVNDERGVAESREQRLRFDAKLEKIAVLDAFLVRPDGARERVQPRDIQVLPDAVTDGDVTFKNQRFLQIRYPTLHAGDKYYLKFRTTGVGSPAFPGQFFASLVPDPGPAPRSLSLSLSLPASKPLKSVARGFVAFEPIRNKGRILYRWISDGQAVEPYEADVADESAQRKMLSVSTFTSYAELARAFAKQLDKQVQPSSEVSRVAEQVVRGLPEPGEKALAINRWVQQNIRYRAVYADQGPWLFSRSATEILHARYGDCKDHVVLMEAMLRAVGIQSTPAMVDRGRDHFTLPQIASPFVFDHVITYVPELDLYLDPSFKDIAGRYLPPSELDKPTLLVRNATIGHTPRRQAGRVAHRFMVDIQPDGSAWFTYTVRDEGYLAAQSRYALTGLGRFRPGTWTESMLKARGWTGGGSDELNGTDSDPDAYTHSYSGRIDAFLRKSGPLVLDASSSLRNEIRRTIARAYWADRERTHPFVCDRVDVQETATYFLPPGLNFADIPSDTKIKDDFIAYSATYWRNGNALTIERHLQREKAESRICTPEDYQAMRPAIEVIQRDLESKIALVPKAPD
jgi:transglutaminase-like putative cysteine protease